MAKETTIGYKRILRLPDTKTSAVKFTILDAKDSPVISHLAFYNAPKLLLPPTIARDKNGLVSFDFSEDGLEAFYSLDGSDPKSGGVAYKENFELLQPATLKAVSKDPVTGEFSEPITIAFSLAKKKWKVIDPEKDPIHLIDDNPSTNYISKQNKASIDLGENQEVSGFTYYPIQNRYMSGLIKDFEFHTSIDGKNWQKRCPGSLEI